jgi:hypothetical protein
MNVSTNVTNFRNEAYTWYQILRQDIYNIVQRWIDAVNGLATNVVQKVPLGGGVTQNTNVPFWKRLIGAD